MQNLQEKNKSSSFHLYQILIVGVGGQGVITASRFFREFALANPWICEMVSSETRGVSQREGSVSSLIKYLYYKKEENREHKNKQKDLHLYISPKLRSERVNILIALEPLELLRALKSIKHADLIVTNTQSLIPKSIITHNRDAYPNIERILPLLKKRSEETQIIIKNYSQEALDRGLPSYFVNRLMLEDLSDYLPPFMEKELFKKKLKDFFHV